VHVMTKRILTNSSRRRLQIMTKEASSSPEWASFSHAYSTAMDEGLIMQPPAPQDSHIGS
jgi:hypothetical protein